MVTPARIAALASAVPATAMDQQALWDEHFAAVYGDDQRAARIWRAAGVRTRHGVADPRDEDVSSWGTEARMQRFVTEAMPLGKESMTQALATAGVEATDVGLFAVVSCTGYATPGLDITLARDLGMAESVQRLSIGHMGCYAALPGLGAAADFVAARGRPAAVLCCELTSLHVQPPSPAQRAGRVRRQDMQQVVAHSLFADGAAAGVIVPGSTRTAGSVGLELLDIEASTDSTTSDYMSWDVTDLGFRMGLSPRVPDVLARHLRPLVVSLLGRHGLSVPEVTAWAVHPGGPRILDVAADSLGLEASCLAASRDVLRDHGNCSSATVLLVMQRILDTQPPAPGDHVVMLAFGPGLTLYAALLRAT